MRKIFYTLSLLILCFSGINCQKDVSYEYLEGAASASITSTLQGNVIDENNMPASLVTIQVGNKKTVTDDKGYFRINNASLNKSASMVTATLPGYYKTYRVFNASKAVNQINIKLIKKELSGSFNAVTGGTISLATGSSIRYEPNSLSKKSGGAYSGVVNIYASDIDPTQDDIAQKVPGSFLANDKENKRVLLISYGMMVVEMETPSGEKLQLTDGATAKIKFSIPAALRATSPATIPLWFVDETNGIWKEEGVAIKNGDSYSGYVKHFTYWNCDVPGEKVNLTTKLVNQNGMPLNYIDITVRPLNGYASAHGISDSLGMLNGPIPANVNLVLEVRAPSPCYGIIYSQNIGPFSADVNLGTITINNQQNLITVEGNLIKCNGSPVTNGYATINYKNVVRLSPVNANGHFVSTFLSCGTNATDVLVAGTDISAQQQSAPFTFPDNTTNINTGTISACGTTSIEFINYRVNDTTTNLSSISPDNEFFSIDSSLNGTNSNLTIRGLNFNGKSLYFTFNNNKTVGSFPITYLFVNSFFNVTPVQPLIVTITNYANTSGQFYEGNFSGQFRDALNVIHSITCSFRVKRN